MTNKFRFTLLSMAALGLFSCSDKLTDDGLANQQDDDGKYAYFNAAISLPSASGMRSATDTEGDTNSDGQYGDEKRGDDYEYGYDYENEVRSMILVIAKDSNYITHTVIPNITLVPETGKEFKFTVKSKIPYDVLETAYGTGGLLNGDNKKVQLYAYCNYTANIFNKFEGITDTEKTGGWLNWEGTVEEKEAGPGKKPSITNSIWSQRSFLMTNAEVYETDKFPATLGGWDAYANQNNPLDLTAETTEGSKTVRKALPVERATARIDFKDGSDYTADNKKVPNTYALETVITEASGGDDEGDDEEEETKSVTKNYFSVQLTRMALVNMSKKFYYLRRVSDDGQAKANNGQGDFYWEIGKPETPNNYVVDVDETDKIKEKGIIPSTARQHFNFPLFDEHDANPNYDKNAWYIDDIEDVLKSTTDNWGDKNYKIWRYVTENTIPAKKSEDATKGDDVSQQKTIQSTGVVFKGAIIAGNDLEKDGNSLVSAKVAEALQKAALPKEDKEAADFDYQFPVLYSFNNILYADISELITAAYNDGPNGPLRNAIDKALEAWKLDGTTYKYNPSNPSGETTETPKLTVETCYYIMEKDEAYTGFTVDFLGSAEGDQDDFMKAVAHPNINVTVYEATDEGDSAGMGYYCYYFYWNRHNDNMKPGKMGPMEFATVRNNVYKLSVTGINQLGHPRNTDHDPDPVDPEDPDEDPMNYIKVDVQVLPWVVRVNDIEF